MEKSKGKRPGNVFKVSLDDRPDFDGELQAAIFDSLGNLLDQVPVKSGKVRVDLPESTLKRSRLFIAPATGDGSTKTPTLESMNRVGAYQARIAIQGQLQEHIHVPGIIIDKWLLCTCYVHGQVVRSSDNRAVCGARVHICEVDRLPWWIVRLPEHELFRLRDDILDILRNPPIEGPVGPIPGPDPDPFPPGPGPGPDPLPIKRPLFRFGSHFDPELEVSSQSRANPNTLRQANKKSLGEIKSISQQVISPELQLQLQTPSAEVLKGVLAENWKLIYPWFCLWPWWWWRFRCDEVAVVTTDANGRFEANVYYPCAGDHPDLYFWVEYDFGSGYETVYHPPIACHTYWNYACGSEITIRVTDSRVPGCTDEPDLPGCQVVIASIGNKVSVREINTNSSGPALEGLLNNGHPFGGTLEPRVDFSRTCLIDTKNVPYYRWSYRRLSGPDGISTSVSAWTIMTRTVVRHYRDGTSYPADLMGPMPTSDAPAENLFRIRPLNPPLGAEWKFFNEHVDLATAYFETSKLPGTPASGPTETAPAPDDLAAGRYELKFELFDGTTGDLVNWTSKGIDLRIMDEDAPFGSGTLDTIEAPAYNKILNSSGHLLGFKMTLRVDNNHCFAEVLAVEGDVTPDPVCGFHNYDPGDDVRLRFVARHPNNLATYAFNTFRASGPAIPVAATSGVSGEPGTSGYTNIGGFQYEKDIAVSALLSTCSNAAFAERLDVVPMAQNGYTRLDYLRDADNAAFALAQPCPPCVCPEDDTDSVN